MTIEGVSFAVKDIYNGYADNGDDGVVAFGGTLDVRPPYQREFVYEPKDEEKVIQTIIKGFPLNVMYWGTTSTPGYYELIDGQQRTMSICRFIHGDYSISYEGKPHSFISLPQEVQNQIRNYKLQIFKCDGTAKERLDWFRTINIAGKKLNAQELLNASYNGRFVSDAKKYFSKSKCPAIDIGGKYIKGEAKEQEILALVLKWAAHSESKSVEDYMDSHKNDESAKFLWEYFCKVLDWVKTIFPDDLDEINKVQWGILYNKYSEKHNVDNDGKIAFFKKSDGEALYTRAELIDEINFLMEDDDITKKTGIYDYIFSGDERQLSIRTFSDKIKKKVYAAQKGLCKICGKPFDIKDMHADHIDPWSKGGATIESNCQMLCVDCNLSKSNKLEKAQNEIYCRGCGKPAVRGMYCQYCGTKN